MEPRDNKIGTLFLGVFAGFFLAVVLIVAGVFVINVN